MGCAHDPDLGVGAPRAGAAAPRRAGARAPHRHERRRRAHGGGRRPPHGLAFERFLEASNTADVQVAVLSNEDRRRRRGRSTALQADPAVEHAAPVYMTVGLHRGHRVRPRRSSPVPIHPLFAEIDDPADPRGTAARTPSDPHEVLVNRVHAAGCSASRPGDTVTVGTFSAEQLGGDEDVFAEPAGPAHPARGDRHREHGLRPRRPGVHRVLRDARVPRGVLGRGRRLRAHRSRSTTAPGDGSGEVVERATRRLRSRARSSSPRAPSRRDGGGRHAGPRGRACGPSPPSPGWPPSSPPPRPCAAGWPRRPATSRASAPWGSAAASAPRRSTSTVLPAVAAGGALAVRPRRRGIDGDADRRAPGGPSHRRASTWTCSRSGSARSLLIAVLAAQRLLRGRCARPASGSSASREATRTPTLRLAAARAVASRRRARSGVAMALDPGEGRTAVPVRSALVGAVLRRRRGRGRGDVRRRARRPGRGPRARAAGTGRSRPTSPTRTSSPSSTSRAWRTSGVLRYGAVEADG